MPVQQRGLEQEQEQLTSALVRDTRTLGQRVTDFLKESSNVALIITALALSGFVVPAIIDIVFIIGLFLFLFSSTRHYTLPFRMPKRTKWKDYNTPKPGTNKPSIAAGIYFLGNDRKTNDELWFTNDDMRTHVLIFGSTGSGKTEAMVSVAYNALVQGSGFIYVDGKGDNSVFARIFSLVRSMGREDDLLLINFMTGARDIIGPQEKRLSNTMNPFATGSSSMLSQLVVGLMEASGEKSSGDMWKGRAIAFVEALMRVLVYMRDAGHILLDANTIRNYFLLERLEAMVMDKIFIRDNQEPVSLEGVPSIVLEPMNNYIFNLPGYNKEKKGKQVSQVLEQHGYITMQLTRVFSSLADTYGHIIRTSLPEVDLRDVVLNRRILVVLLPALEKSPDELANLGKIIIASLKAMMAAGLGDEVEGMYSQVISRKPTNARNPFLCILDEYGYYAVPGFAVVPAQARSLGFSVVFAGQDLPAFQKASKEEAASIGANTNIKICMKLEDPMETWEFFMKSAGEAHVSVVGGYQSDAQSLTGQYVDSRNVQMEKRSRVDLLDLKEQREGEAHIFFKSRIVRAKMFYANPPPVKELRLNQFVKVDVPPDAVLRNLVVGFENFKKLFQEGDKIFNEVKLPDDNIKVITELFSKQEIASPIDKGLAVFMSYCSEGEMVKTQEEAAEFELAVGELDVFTKLSISDYLKTVLLTDDVEKFSQPILTRSFVLEQIKQIEAVFNSDQKSVQEVSQELVNDMHTATFYPPEVKDIPEVKQLVEATTVLVKQIIFDK
jgi:intracellular multiplication protein IcmO